METDHNVVLSPTEARQGKTGMGVRYVLVASTAAAIAVMAIVYTVFTG